MRYDYKIKKKFTDPNKLSASWNRIIFFCYNYKYFIFGCHVYLTNTNALSDMFWPQS